MRKTELVKICPSCKSTDVTYATQLGGANIGGGDHFYCKNCLYGKFQQVIFEEVPRSSLKKYPILNRKSKK